MGEIPTDKVIKLYTDSLDQMIEKATNPASKTTFLLRREIMPSFLRWLIGAVQKRDLSPDEIAIVTAYVASSMISQAAAQLSAGTGVEVTQATNKILLELGVALSNRIHAIEGSDLEGFCGTDDGRAFTIPPGTHGHG